jgi:beta-glucosidase
MGIAATRALQQRTAPNASTNLSFLLTSQVTRHFMGTHGATDMPHNAEEYILPQWREEHQLRIYEAFQRPERGDAEGIMCAISAFAEAGDVPPPRNNLTSGVLPWTPNCANKYLLQTKLRDAWGSGAFVQSDCCDSIDAVLEHDYTATLPEAVAAVLDAGLSASYGNPSGITAALLEARATGLVANATIDAAIKRTLLTLFRVGMFDTNNSANPYRGPYDETALDGPAHRALAREAAAKTMVLLENKNATLPLAALPPKVAVIGPFSDCTTLAGSYGGHEKEWPNFACSYTHTYVGSMSAVSTLRAAVAAEAAAGGSTEVRWALGSGFGVPAGADGLVNASAAAAWADLVVLAVGLGTAVEAEGRDRVALTLSAAQAALVDAVAGAVRPGATLVVAIASAGGVDLVVPRADAVLQMFYSGEETGSAFVDLLRGRAVPSAKLPETIYANEYLDLVEPEINFNMITRGTGRTYRFFDEARALANNASVAAYTRYRFGYGLSYCTFAYSNLALAYDAATGSVGVDVDVAATGSTPSGLACTEVTEVYLTLPKAAFATPLFSLVAFAATPLLPAGAPPTHLHFDIADYDLWTTYVDGTRALAGGDYAFAVGGHLPGDARGAGNVLSGVVSIPSGAVN